MISQDEIGLVSILTSFPVRLQYNKHGKSIRRNLMSDTIEDVKAVIADVMKIDVTGIKPDTRFIEDLKADSMDQFFLIDGFSEKFKLTISDEDARNIKSVNDVVSYVDSHK
jgi:acyl carrier protein